MYWINYIFLKNNKISRAPESYLRGFLPPGPTALASLFVTALNRDIVEDNTNSPGSVDDNLPNGTFIQLVFKINF